MSADPDPIAAFLPSSAVAPQEAVIAMIASIDRTVRLAHALVGARRTVELAGLQEAVGLLCARVLDLPYAEGRALRQRLDALDRELATLEARLRRR